MHEHVRASVLRMIDRLVDSAARVRSSARAVVNSPLLASLVEMGPVACTCDSLSFVTDSLRAEITGAGGLFGTLRRAVRRYLVIVGATVLNMLR